MSKNDSPSEKIVKIQTKAQIIQYIIQLSLIIIFFSVIIRITIAASGSMEPTLKTGDYVIYSRLAYLFSDVKRGDIITFWSDEHNLQLSKRVIGIAGDIISFEDGYVHINGFIADESAYLSPDIETNSTRIFSVPEGTVFVLGDNRENSCDSRFFAQPYIPINNIEGKYIGTLPFP